MDYPGVKLLKAQMNTDLLTENLKKGAKSNQSFWLMGSARRRATETSRRTVRG
jgi:hypothetical protein